jgi:hypothetical protein
VQDGLGERSLGRGRFMDSVPRGCPRRFCSVRAKQKHLNSFARRTNERTPVDLDVAQRQPIAAALGAMIAFDNVTRLGPSVTPTIVLPTGVG